MFTLTATNTHYSTFSDSYTHKVEVSFQGSSTQPTQQSAVEPSTRSLYLNQNKTTLQLFILQDIYNLSFSSSENIILNPTTKKTLSAGDVVDVLVTIASNKTLEETVTVSWSESTETKQLELFVSYTPVPPEELNYYSLIGRILGMLSLILLIASIVLSGIHKKIRSSLNKLFAPKKRIWLHCYISWALLLLSIIHGLLLLLGPYADFLTKSEIILGYITAISMGIVSINGSLRTYIVNKFGANLWRKTHGYYSYISLLLCIIHAYLIGTEFEILRSLF